MDKKPLAFLVNIILSAFAALISLLAVFVVVGLILSSLGIAQFGAMDGVSMEPAVPNKSLIIVTPVPSENLKVGDIVKYKTCTTGAEYIRRIVDLPKDPKTGRTILKTKADTFQYPDAWECVAKSEKAFVYRTHVPKLGELYILLEKPANRIILIAAAVVLLFLSSISSAISIKRNAEDVNDREKALADRFDELDSQPAPSEPKAPPAAE